MRFFSFLFVFLAIEFRRKASGAQIEGFINEKYIWGMHNLQMN